MQWNILPFKKQQKNISSQINNDKEYKNIINDIYNKDSVTLIETAP